MPTNRQPIAKVASKRKPNRLARLNISVLEADVAYFDARLAMLDGSPDSFHQEAQIRVYSELERVLSGDDKGAHRDALLMGTSLVLEVQGVASDANEGVALAAAAIDDGRAGNFLATLRAHFQN